MSNGEALKMLDGKPLAGGADFVVAHRTAGRGGF